MTTVTFKFPEELNARLEAAARRQRVSKSKLVRRAVEESLSRNGADAPGPSLHERAKHVCGTLRGGPTDVSTNPKYLEDFGA